jgi:hypothetical protein
MVSAVIVHEVEEPDRRKTQFTSSGKFFDWFDQSPLFASVGLRQFGQGSSSLLKNATVWLAPETHGQHLVLVSNGKKLNLLCHVIYDENVSESKLNDLRRPGVKSTSSSINQLGLKLKTDVNIYSTTASIHELRTESLQASNGWVVFDSSKQQPTVLLGMLLLTSLCVASERSLVNQAQVLVATGKRNLFAYQPILHRLRAWSTLPPVDNTSLASKYLGLRDSLNLEIRRNDVLKALELKERNLALIFGVIGALIGVVATIWAALK